MEKQRTRKVLIVVALLLVVIGTTIAFAALSTTLNINGTAQVTPARWEIKFANLSAMTEVGDGAMVTTPTLADTTIQTYNVKLTKPGDSVSFTFDVVNAGTLDAKLTTLTQNTVAGLTYTGTGATASADEAIVENNLIYTLTYTSDGSTVGQNDVIDAGTSKTMRVTLTYPSTATAVPADDVAISGLGITFIYTQNP